MARLSPITTNVITRAIALAPSTKPGWNPSDPLTPLSRICWINTGVTRRPTAVATAMPMVNTMPVRSSGLTTSPRRSTSMARTDGVSCSSVSSSV